MFDEMMDNVIRKFGFEANETITFCILCEQVENGLVKEDDKFSVEKLYDVLMES